MLPSRRKFDKFTAELHPIPVKDKVWDKIGVDLIGPLPTTDKGNKYIMTVSCLFSKWPEAFPLKDKGAAGIAELLFQCFCRHGCCEVKITDQGREFVNQVQKLYSLNLKTHTVLPRTEAHAFNKLNLKRMLKAPRTDAHVLLFENVRLLLNCLLCNLVVCV